MAFVRHRTSSGLDLTLHSSPHIAANAVECGRVASLVEAYVKQVCVYGRAWDCILAACQRPSSAGDGTLLVTESVLPHLLACDFYVAKSEPSRAQGALDTATAIFERHAAQADAWSQYERLYFQAFTFIRQADLPGAIRVLHELLTLAPCDLFAVKKVQLLCFILGDRAGMLRVVQRPDVADACRKLPYYHGMLAFALEECDQMRASRDAALAGLALNPQDPWCVHAMAHILFAEGELEDGLAWLNARRAVWSECMSFLYTHTFFHMALLELDRDAYGTVASILDEHVWPHDTDAAPVSTLAHVNPSSSFGTVVTADSFPRHDRDNPEDRNAALNLLWRFEIRCTTAPSSAPPSPIPSTAHFDSRWRSTLRAPAQVASLFGLIQLYALFRCGERDKASRLHAQIQSAVAKMPAGDLRDKMQAVLLPIAEAIVAVHTEIDDQSEAGAQRAFDLLRPIFDADGDATNADAASHHPAASPAAASASMADIAAHDDDLSPPPTPEPPLHQPHHLASLCASGEQLEVLREWWMHLCLRARQPEALRRTLRQVPDARRHIAWYARLHAAADAF